METTNGMVTNTPTSRGNVRYSLLDMRGRYGRAKLVEIQSLFGIPAQDATRKNNVAVVGSDHYRLEPFGLVFQ